MLDDGSEIKQGVVIAGVLPVEKHHAGRGDDVLGHQVIVTTTKVVRQAQRLNDSHTMSDKPGIPVINIGDISSRRHRRIK